MLPPEAIAAGVARSLTEACHREQATAAILEAAQGALFLVDLLIRRFETDHDLPLAIVCQPGCSFCCFNQVEVTAPEALLVGHFIAARFSPAKVERLRTLLGELASFRAGLSKIHLAVRRREHPCPLLHDGYCAVYPVRPLTCRAMHAMDAGHCQTSLESGGLIADQYYQHRHDLALAVSRGLQAGAAAAGCQNGVLNLATALQDFFATDEAPARWAAGERIFTE